jgi:hypothetical protein
VIRITLNKPAYEAFVAGDDYTGMKVRIDHGILQFKPVYKIDEDDVAPFEERTRGGIGFTIEGYWQDDIMKALDVDASKPYFILQRAGKGWISATHHSGAPRRDPPRTIPVMRVWSHKVPSLNQEQLADVGGMDVPLFVTEVRRAKQDIDAYFVNKRPGRPPKEITDKQELLRYFVSVALEVMDVSPILDAQRALADFIDKTGIDSEAARRNPEQSVAASDSPVVAAPQSAPVEAVRTPPVEKAPLKRTAAKSPEKAPVRPTVTKAQKTVSTAPVMESQPAPTPQKPRLQSLTSRRKSAFA